MLDRVAQGMDATPTVVSLFSGGGGLTLGFARAGFRILLGTDIERSSEATFRLNFPNVPFFLGDLRHLSQEALSSLLGSSRVDVVVGGPPCQGFSTLGDQNPADPRNALFQSFARVVRWLEPQCLVMENVSYLRSQYGGRFEKEIVGVFEDLGYAVSVRTLDAAEYGVPQFRKRVFFVGIRSNEYFVWPTPTHGPNRAPFLTVGEAIRGLEGDCAKVSNHDHLNHSAKVIERYKLIPEGGRMPPPALLPPEIRRKNFGNTYKRLHRAKPSLTLVPGNNAFPVHPTKHRSLSAREAARIQTFPDSYIFCGTRAQQCRLVGNAVPVELAKALGRAIIKQIDCGSSNKTARELSVSYSWRRPPPEPTGNIRAVSFFTGVGGLLLGFENAGIEVAASYDMKKSVEQNLKINFPHLHHLRKDIASLTADEVIADVDKKPIDVVFGGTPCQGFSIFGRRRFVRTQGHLPDDDPRNELSIKFVEIAIALAPKVIFLENVKGFVSTPRRGSSYLSDIESMLRNAGYDCQHRIVNCANYGVPQTRERFILIAAQQRLEGVWPDGSFHLDPQPWQKAAMTVGDVITDLMDSRTYNPEFSHVPMNHKPLVVERYKLIPEGGRLPDASLPDELRKGYRSDNIKNYSHVYRRLSMSQPATTMVPGHNAFPVHPRLHRTLTVREAARIQTFPDWMKFVGTRQQQCTLVGNAVPPLLAEVFAARLVKFLTGVFDREGYKRDVYDLAAAR